MSRKPTRPQGRSRLSATPWGTDDAGCTIIHVDMDAFFAAVEVLDNPELEGKPVIVGGTERGVVSAASYEARAYGVRSAMPTAQARRLCPHAIVVPGRHHRYGEVSKVVMEVLATITDTVEPLSVDEAFLDVAGAQRRLGSPLQIAHLIRRRIRAATSLAASVGVASTKHVAKIASGAAKPDGLLLVPHAATLDFLHPLPVGALWGVGERTEEILLSRGWRTVGDLAAANPDTVARAVGQAHGASLVALANGHDPRRVQTEREDKSVGHEQTFASNITSRAELDRILLSQAHRCAARLRRSGWVAGTVSIKVRFADFTTITRSHTMGHPTNLAHDIVAATRALLQGVVLPPSGVRLLGTRLERITSAASGIQIALDDNPDLARAEETLDSIHAKFGRSALSPAALLRARRDQGAPGEQHGG